MLLKKQEGLYHGGDNERVSRGGILTHLADNGLKLGQPVEQLVVSICARAPVLFTRREDALEPPPEAVWTRVGLGALDFSLATVDTA